jgi:hypothetical protein
MRGELLRRNSNRMGCRHPYGLHNPTTQKYSITVKMNAGQFKFRLNRDWGTNYGDKFIYP